MPESLLMADRRTFLAATAAAGATLLDRHLVESVEAAPRPEPAGHASIRPFSVHMSDDALADMRRRILATRWPERETVSDTSQGVPLATTRDLAAYWAKEHDWRRVEAQLNSLPQFITSIDGLDIHFLHVRSRHENAMPLVVTHGWPGSVIEQLKIIGPLTNPTAYGASASDAFHVVIPSMPGYGFSGKPTAGATGAVRPGAQGGVQIAALN